MPTPDSIPVPSNQLASIAIEHWRLTKTLGPILDHPQLAPARHALRKIDDFLKSCGIEVQSLDGLPYDPGINARVVERIVSPGDPKGTAYIAETLAPLVLHKGNVLRSAEIVVADES